MPIFRLEDAKLVVAREAKIKRESDLEDWLENSPMALVQDEFILWVGRQPSAQDEEGTIFPDLLGVDSERNLVIIEFKRGRTPRDVVAQLLEYAAWANELSENQIHEIAEAYFEGCGELKGKSFDNAFRDTFDIPETDELPPLNQKLRLFIVAEEMPTRITQVCRFLRTSYRVDVSCIAVSKFRTESEDEIVSMETRVGKESFTTPKDRRQQVSPPSRWSGDKLAREVVWDAVQKLTQDSADGEFTIKQVLALIREDDPDFKRGTMDGTMIENTVNHPSRRHHPSASHDHYWRVDKGMYRLYDPEKDKMNA